MYSDIEIYNSNITNNIARNISSPQGNQPGEGGGIMSHSSNLILSNCIFFNNEAEGGIDSSKGGAISNQGGDIIFNNCLLYNNYAQEGDAIYSTSSNATLNNSIISGIYATQNSSNLNITNSIFWNHNPYGGSGIYISTWNPGSVTISYSCVKNGQSGITPNGGTINWLTGNIEDDPLFIDPENGDFHFFANSPCINAGTPDTTGLNLPEYDLDGNPRIYEDRIDMGCYEWQGTEADDNQLPMTSYQLFNYPNPFNPETTISFSIVGSEDNEQKVSISVFNIRGQKIKTLINKALIPGRYSVIWNSKDENNKPCSSGIYFYKLDVDSKTKATKKMLLLK
ncbi:MAG: T9SS type A sorting domain-containing protein [Candidatus Cloacimonetes bacterium]|nr:T9SS type A sorting domain-containing protein [Candidatus Cloacimonadota bacterium]